MPETPSSNGVWWFCRSCPISFIIPHLELHILPSAQLRYSSHGLNISKSLGPPTALERSAAIEPDYTSEEPEYTSEELAKLSDEELYSYLSSNLPDDDERGISVCNDSPNCLVYVKDPENLPKSLAARVTRFLVSRWR
jgi:hypothetical protein